MSGNDYTKEMHSYIGYNEYRYNYYIKSLSKAHRKIFQSIPLLFHINNNYLPGYIGQSTPCGIKSYTADGVSINAIQHINNKIVLDEIEEPQRRFIDAIYYQEHFKTGYNTLWIVYEDNMNDDEIKYLNKKAKLIEKWVNKGGLSIKLKLASRFTISSVYCEQVNSDFHIDKQFFLEEFYVESILIAGKVPLWWLVGHDSNFSYDNIKNDDSVENEYIDFGAFNLLRPQDYYSAAIWYLLNIAKAPVTTWLDLSLLLYKVTDIDLHESYSDKLKIVVHAGYLESYDQNPRGLYASYTNNVINDVINDQLILINNLFIQVISHYFHSGQKTIRSKSIFDYLYETRASAPGAMLNTNPSVEEYMSSLESMYMLAEDIFTRFQDTLAEMDGVKLDEIKYLNPMSDRLLNKLKHSSKNIHILSNPKEGYFSQEKAVIKYNENSRSPWVLAFPISANVTKDVKSFDSVVELLVWSYVNQVVDTTTKILADCSLNVISSMDIVNTIRLLAKNLDLTDINSTDLNAYVSNPVPVKSLVFVDQISRREISNVAQIHQLIIFNNGEFHTHQYNGYDQFIECAYNWFNLLNHSELENKPSIKIFAIKPGGSQELKSSMSGFLHELGSYFDSNPISNTRTILKNDDKYYVSHITNDTVTTSAFENMRSLYDYLEHPLSEFTACIFTETFEQDAMLSYLLMQNKKNTMQLFYYIEGSSIRAFIFDANGALFTYEQELTHRQSFINNWMDFLNNMRGKHSYDLPVEFNQLLKLDDISYEHVPLTGDKLPSDNKYYTLDLKVTSENNSFEIEFTCEDKVFSSGVQGSSLYSEISKFVSKKLNVSKNMPVYISDIDVPDELLGGTKNRDTYLIDYLKYKRNVEKRLIDKINSLA